MGIKSSYKKDNTDNTDNQENKQDIVDILNKKKLRINNEIQYKILNLITNDSKYSMLSDGSMYIVYQLGKYIKKLDCNISKDEEIEIVRKIVKNKQLYIYTSNKTKWVIGNDMYYSDDYILISDSENLSI